MKNGMDYKVTESVNKVKNHSTILMWGIGNEWNGDQDYQNFGSNIYWRMVYLTNLADQIKSLDTNSNVSMIEYNLWGAAGVIFSYRQTQSLLTYSLQKLGYNSVLY